MQKNRIAILSGIVYFLSWVSAPALAGYDTQVNGTIVSRTGEILIINSENGRATVVLTSNTTTKDDSGLFGPGKQENLKDIRESSDRFARLSDYALKVKATVKFAPGGSDLSSADMAKLQELAQEATSITGYLIEVIGFADSNGDALISEKLSGKRARKVIAYLVQECNIPAHHIVAPGAMGVYEPVASKETKEGRAENRRVEVKVLINKVIAGA